MSSKSPVRSCEDVDETALSYAEIKALCAGNPLIAEKMSLDNEVAKLRMLKSEHQSQHYRLQDDLMKRFPEQITAVTERIVGIEKDIATYAAEKEKCMGIQLRELSSASISANFPGMVIDGVTYQEKEHAAKALLDVCKGIKGKASDIPVGEYMGFRLSMRYENFRQQMNLFIRGHMTYQIDLGTDAFGNISRINHALDKLPERLDGAKIQLDNLNSQVEAAKSEIQKTFEQESELQEKEARLALLNSDLNIDGKGDLDILNDADDADLEEEYTDNTPSEYCDEDAQCNSHDKNMLSSAEHSMNPEFDVEHLVQTETEKARSSILDGIRNFNSEKYNNVPVNTKSLERGI